MKEKEAIEKYRAVMRERYPDDPDIVERAVEKYAARRYQKTEG